MSKKDTLTIISEADDAYIEQKIERRRNAALTKTRVFFDSVNNIQLVGQIVNKKSAVAWAHT